MHFSQLLISLVFVATAVTASPTNRRAAFTLQNGKDAQALNREFQTLNPNSPCKAGQSACVKNQFAQCVNGKFQLTPCAATEKCFALPLVNKPGTSITCDTQADAEARIAATGATGGGPASKKPKGKGARELDVEERDTEARSTPAAPPACKAKGKRDLTTSGARSLLLKRIAQPDLGQVAQSWQNLCVKSGGKRDPNNDPCVELAGIKGINALLAGADPCAQQDNADSMIDFAKQPGIKNEAALIANAVAFRKHPRNALDIGGVVPSTPFCERAPRNPELKGVVNAQLAGVNGGLFGGPKFPVVAFGAAGTCPFGQTPDVATCTCH